MELECRRGDIVSQPAMDAVVNAANAELMTGGGVAGAIHQAAGPGLAEECRPLAPIQPGEAVIAPGYGRGRRGEAAGDRRGGTQGLSRPEPPPSPATRNDAA